MIHRNILRILAGSLLLVAGTECLHAQWRVGPAMGYEFGLPTSIDRAPGVINTQPGVEGSGESYNHTFWMGAGFFRQNMFGGGWDATARLALGIGSGRFRSAPYDDDPELDLTGTIIYPRRRLDLSAITGSLRLDAGASYDFGGFSAGGGLWLDTRFLTQHVLAQETEEPVAMPDTVIAVDGGAGASRFISSSPLSFGPSLALAFDIPIASGTYLRPELFGRMSIPRLLESNGGSFSGGLSIALMFDLAGSAQPLSEAPPEEVAPLGVVPAAAESDIAIDLYAGDGNERATTASVGLRNTLHRRHLPLLPIIAYGHDSVSIPSRYTRLGRDEADRFSLSSLAGLSPAFLHAQMLNIIGMRMKAEPAVGITITAAIGANEQESTGRARAREVAAYLANVWGIDGSRVISEVRQGDNSVGSIRIRSRSSALFAPVVLQWIAREIAVPPIGLDPHFDATRTRSWKIVVTQGNRTLGEYGSQTRATLDGIDLPLLLRGRHGDSTLVPLIATLTVEENDGETRTARDELQLVWSDDTTARNEKTRSAEIFSYLLIDPPEEFPELSTTNRAMMLKIQESARRGARMTLSGFGRTKPIAERAGGEILAALEKRQVGDVEVHVITDPDRVMALPEEVEGSSGVDVVVENE